MKLLLADNATSILKCARHQKESTRWLNKLIEVLHENWQGARVERYWIKLGWSEIHSSAGLS